MGNLHYYIVIIFERLQDNFPHKIWKFSYSGGRAQEMINHLPCERLPGESRIRDIILHIGTNDVSRERGIKNKISDIEAYLTNLIDLLSKMYPQARIIFSCILPRMDNDHFRTIQVNTVSFNFNSACLRLLFRL